MDPLRRGWSSGLAALRGTALLWARVGIAGVASALAAAVAGSEQKAPNRNQPPSAKEGVWEQPQRRPGERKDP